MGAGRKAGSKTAPPPEARLRFGRRDIYIVLVLAAACLAIYGPVISYSFVNFDDDLYVYQNASTQAGLTAANIARTLVSTDVYYWHPLSLLSHTLDVTLFGLNAGAHHGTNLLIHILNSLLVYLFLRRITGAVWRAAAVAALFAVHPLHVESVAWVSERKDVLCGLFFLLALLAYAWYAERPSARRMAAVTAAFVCALMSKPMAVTFPFVLLLLDYWPLNRFQEARIRGRALHLLWEKLPLLCLALLDGIATARIQEAVGATTLIGGISLSMRIGNALAAYVQYLGRTFWPSSLAVLYIHPRGPDVGQWAAALALALITVLVVWGARRYRYLATGWFWFVGMLAPAIGLIQVGYQASADRFVYLPHTGLFIVLVWGAADLASRWGGPRAAALTAAAVLAALAAQCRVQVGYWRDGVTLFEHAAAVTRDNYVVHTLLGAALMERDRVDEAVPHFREAVRIEPRYVIACNDLGVALARQGRYEEALPFLDRAVRVMPEFGPAHYNRGSALMRRGRNDEALAEFLQALGRNIPPHSRYVAYNNVGAILNNRGDYRQASENFERALAIETGSAEARKNLAAALFNQGRVEEAIAHMTICVRRNPSDADAAARLAAMQSRRPAR